jgi:hypothetical protein
VERVTVDRALLRFSTSSTLSSNFVHVRARRAARRLVGCAQSPRHLAQDEQNAARLLRGHEKALALVSKATLRSRRQCAAASALSTLSERAQDPDAATAERSTPG